MARCRGEMTSRRALLLAATLALLAPGLAGPLGPLPNTTSSDLGLKEGSCALGDVVYMPGDEFPGSSACERCACVAGAVSCSKQRCDPRPGCKALHRPDQCCPTYQCECEQDGRVYGNGEKLVDPSDPCRVCYCQGGEVVCRRIACFVRDDCTPRHVPGRCCPEYDNCPLRGVTTIPGVAPLTSTTAAPSKPAPAPPKDIGQEITIKEITPVSEIPVITEVKIKEILPSPSIEVAEYSSSKSPLIVREATSEKPLDVEASLLPLETPVIIEVQPSSPPIIITPLPSEVDNFKTSDSSIIKDTNDSPPSKISLPTQDSTKSENTPSLTSAPTMGVPSVNPDVVYIVSTTKAPVITEDDSTLFDHNPAFPPLPDDLSIVGNHEDDIIQEQTLMIDNEHTSDASSVPLTEAVIIEKPVPTTAKNVPEIIATDKTTILETSSAPVSTVSYTTTTKPDTTITDMKTTFKDSPMLNLRSAIPTEILNVPSAVPEEITGEVDKDVEPTVETTTSVHESTSILTSTVTENNIELQQTTEKPKIVPETTSYVSSTVITADTETTTNKAIEVTTYIASTSSARPQEQTSTSILTSSNTEVTSQTELSSLPVETSDQNPPQVSENISKDQTVTATVSGNADVSTTKILPSTESEVITVSRAIPSSTDNQSFENVETTEFILTSFGSSESATDAVELIKISAEPEKSAAIIEADGKKNTLFTDLINLVGDVASIGDHTDGPQVKLPPATATNIADSEELIPVNAGYKSKNNNWNVNSITEVPAKSKGQQSATKQKVVEIEGEDSEIITDSPSPNDKVEPTTRRPIIDNVSDDMPDSKTEKKDIEIITKSYVPTINRRPTKVVMKKSNDASVSSETATLLASVSAEVDTESSAGDTSAGPAHPAHPAPGDSTTSAP